LWPDPLRARVAPGDQRQAAPLPLEPRPEPPGPTEPSTSQDLPVSQAMRPGSLVRVRSTLSEDHLQARIESADDQQIPIVNRKGVETNVPWPTVQRLEVQVGVHHACGTAALAGGIAGALAGYLVAHSKEPCFAPGCPDEKVGGGPQAVLIGGAFGALL